MLKRLYVDNVRSFSNFTFEPGRVAALVGPNGGGKSSVCKVMGAIGELLVGGQDASRVFMGSRTRWDERLEQLIALDVVADDGEPYSYSLSVMHSTDGREIHVADEQLTTNGQPLYRLTDGEVQLFGDQPTAQPRTKFPFNSTRSFIPQLEARADNKKITTFRRWLAGVWYFALQPQLLLDASEREDSALATTGANFVSWYRALAQEQPQVRESLLSSLRPVIPGLEEIRLVNTGQSTRVMRLECRHPSSAKRYQIGLNELSDGQRSLLVLYTLNHMIAERSTLLMFDEPDNFVAADEIQPWLASIRETVASREATLLVASHHPEVIDYLAPDQVLRLWRDDGPTRIDQPNLRSSEGLPASEVLRLEPTR